MLERVPPSAECVAHIFLRRFEAPVRSHRNLDRAFWRHGYEYGEASTWWPSYLDSVRSRSHNNPYTCQSSELRSNQNATVTPRYRVSRSRGCDARAFTNATKLHRPASAQAVLEDNSEIVEKRTTDRASNDGSVADDARRNDHKDDVATDLRFIPFSSRSKTENTSLSKAWKNFVQSGRKQDQAALLLPLLVEGGTTVNLERCLKAFECIPKGQRTTEDYKFAIQAANRLDQNSMVIQIIKESMARRLDPGLYYDFLALCVEKGLWNTAVDLWNQVGSTSFHTISHESGSNKRNFAGKYAACFDIVVDLPSKLVNLAERLKSNDSVIAARREQLTELCKKLVVIAVESEQVLNAVTSQGLLSLFAIQQHLNFDLKLHFAALATIKHMRENGTKSQLALLIYRNFRHVYPDAFIPKWIFRTMITICSAAREPPEVYHSLLRDYKTTYGTAEDWIYLQVMRACANLGEVADVEAVFNEFCTFSQPKTIDDLRPLLRVHAVTGNAKQAQVQFDQISTQYGFKPDVRSWNALLLANSRSATPSSVFDKFVEMKSSGIRPDEYSWSILVAAAGKKGDTDHAYTLVEQARNAGIPAPPAMIGAVIDSLLMNNRPKEAWKLVLSATQQASVTGESPVRLWNSLLRYFAFKSDSAAILHVQEKMKEFDVKADNMTYAALMTALVVQGRTHDAAQILRTLHFSQALSANEFHYSILIHGFAMEKNRDAAAVVYHEMLERFPRATPSAKLSMVYLQAHRDEERVRTTQLSGVNPKRPDFRPTLDMISDALTKLRPSDIASPVPNPGFGRLPSHSDISNIYFGSLISFLQRNNAQKAAQSVLEATEEHKIKQFRVLPDMQSTWVSSLRLLSQELEVASSTRQWSRVTSIWDQIIELTLQHVVSAHQKGQKSLQNPLLSSGTRNIEIMGGRNTRFSSMIPRRFSSGDIDSAEAQVLPAYQYVLSTSISRYLQALDKQGKYAEMVETIRRLHNHKFSLSNKNWNTFIQCLCRSSHSDHHLLAYQAFERYLLPNAPSWEVIRRGKWVAPSEERPRNEWDKFLKKKDNRTDRKAIEKVDPGLLMPSYYTMVHLAIVWLKASGASSRGDNSLKQRLEELTAGTVRLVLKIPYLRDRVQGLLLRGRNVIGDPTKRPRQQSEPIHFAGVQGSTLLIDRIPSEILTEIETSWANRQTPITTKDLPLAEQLFGEIQQSAIVLPSKARLESESERQARVRTGQQRKLASLAKLREEIRQNFSESNSSVGTVVRGKPPYLPLDGTAHNKHTATDTLQPILSTISKIRSILRRVKRKTAHKPSALSVYNKEKSVRSSLLTRRQTPRMYSPSRLGGLVATPRRVLKPRPRTHRVNKSLIASDGTSASLRLQVSNVKQAQKLAAANESYLARRMARLSRIKYHLETLKISANRTVSKKIAQRLRWHKTNARQTSKRLYNSRLRKKQLTVMESSAPISK